MRRIIYLIQRDCLRAQFHTTAGPQPVSARGIVHRRLGLPVAFYWPSRCLGKMAVPVLLGVSGKAWRNLSSRRSGSKVPKTQRQQVRPKELQIVQERVPQLELELQNQGQEGTSYIRAIVQHRRGGVGRRSHRFNNAGHYACNIRVCKNDL